MKPIILFIVFITPQNQSAPNPSVSAVVFWIDYTPPTLNIDYPTNDLFPITWSNISQVYFENSYNDTLSGINQTSLLVELNGISITSVFTLTDTSACYYPRFDTQEKIDKFLIIWQELNDGFNQIKVSVKDKAGNIKEEFRTFYVTLETIEFPLTPPLNIGLEIVSGNNQSGLVGRCAEQSLVVRAFKNSSYAGKA